MRLPVDQRFVDEATRYSLRATCESCVYFEPEQRTCSEGYPNHEHLELPLEPQQLVCFCKRFELM